jgi:hypothetical protein
VEGREEGKMGRGVNKNRSSATQRAGRENKHPGARVGRKKKNEKSVGAGNHTHTKSHAYVLLFFLERRKRQTYLPAGITLFQKKKQKGNRRPVQHLAPFCV